MFHAAHAPMRTVYTRLAYQSRNLRFGWIALQPTRFRLKYQAGVEPVTGVESKPRQVITPMPDADPPLDPTASVVVRYFASFVMTAVATAVAVGIDSKVTIPNLSLVFVVPVIIAGVSLGLGPSLFSAILGALAFNFFLTEPRYTLAVDDAANIWAIGLLFVVGLIVSGVAFTSGRRAAEAALLRRQASVLQGYSRDIVAADNMKTIVSITSQALAALFQVPVVVMLVTEGTVVSLERVGDVEPQEAELEAARSSLATGTVVRGGIYPDLASRFDFWPVKTSEGQNAVIGLAFDPDERPSAPEALVDIVGSVLALVLDRQHARVRRDARPAI
jgi:K+-sensing histidine kinase KdpD